MLPTLTTISGIFFIGQSILLTAIWHWRGREMRADIRGPINRRST